MPKINDSFIGPSPAFFLAAAVFSPVTLLAIAFGAFCMLPSLGVELPELMIQPYQWVWAHKLPAAGPILIMLVAIFTYIKMLTTAYRIENGCLIRQTMGFGGINTESMTLSLIVDCNARSGWIGAILGYGSLHIRSADHSEDDMFLHGVPNHDQVRRHLNEITSAGQGGRVLGTV